jgi:DNA repair and recombination protein RAD52
LEQERLGGAQGNNPSSSTSTIASTSAAAHPQAPSRITLPPRNNENRDPSGGQQQSSNGHIKAQAPPVGGFHFPPGMNNPLQGQNRGHAPASGAGVKRPLEAMANGGQRGARPGMGLQHASSGGAEVGQNGRQVLGRLDIGESGDVKRMRM